MRVRFYGKLSAALGPQVDIAVETPCTVAGLRRHLRATHPALAEMLDDKRVRAVVGDCVVPDVYRLAPGDELEFLAPVSGG
jgi:molybdopterin converting factor small subunit